MYAASIEHSEGTVNEPDEEAVNEHNEAAVNEYNVGTVTELNDEAINEYNMGTVNELNDEAVNEHNDGAVNTNVPIDALVSSSANTAPHDEPNTANGDAVQPPSSTPTPSALLSGAFHIPPSQATAYVADNLPLVQQLNSTNSAAVKEVLLKGYNTLRGKQAYAQGHSQTIMMELAETHELERVADRNVVASYERAAMKLEAAQEAHDEVDKAACYAEVVHHVRKAKEHSEAARELRNKCHELLKEIAYWDLAKLRLEKLLVDLLYAIVSFALARNERDARGDYTRE